MSNFAEHTAILESLFFTSEQACKAAAAAPVGHPQSFATLRDAETALIRLQSLLGYFSAASEDEQFHCQSLLNDCLARSTRLGINYNQSSARYVYFIPSNLNLFNS